MSCVRPVATAARSANIASTGESIGLCAANAQKLSLFFAVPVMAVPKASLSGYAISGDGNWLA